MDKEDKTELIDSFYQELEFGTGGLRGIMGAGINRMNIYTVGAATQGLSNYLKKNFAEPCLKSKWPLGMIAGTTAGCLLKPVPKYLQQMALKCICLKTSDQLLSCHLPFRELGCQSGIILTASHNPKEYNGYKAYWDDGSQIVAPHDVNIIKEVTKGKSGRH